MSDASATKSIAEASKEQRGDLSYHYFHTEKGDAPVAAPKVSHLFLSLNAKYSKTW